ETGLHCAAFGGHAVTVRLLLERGAPVNVKDKEFESTPLGWALYAWGENTRVSKNDCYYEVVARLVAAGATVNPEWLADSDREMPLPEKIRADPQMLAALMGEMTH